MTGSTDLDRLLGAYLDEGPRRAPDGAVDAAIAFARSHPRRRDPLRFLRPDVMPSRRSMFIPQLAWAALVVVLTLGAVAAFAIGSRPNDAPILPPPTVIESPAPTPQPSASLGPSPSVLALDLSDSNEPGASADTGSGFSRTLTVDDASGTVVDVERGPVPVDEPVDEMTAAADPENPSRVILRWPFKPCDEALLLSVDAAGDSFVLERQGCVVGDAIGGEDHQVVLTFRGPVDPATFDLELVETP
jgi:hypothetical protein